MERIGRIGIEQTAEAVIVHAPRAGAPFAAGPELIALAIWLPLVLLIWFWLPKGYTIAFVAKFILIIGTIAVLGALVSRFTLKETIVFTADQIVITQVSPATRSEKTLPAGSRWNLRAIPLTGLIAVAFHGNPAPGQTFRRGAVILDGPRHLTGFGFGITSEEGAAITRAILTRFPHYGPRNDQ